MRFHTTTWILNFERARASLPEGVMSCISRPWASNCWAAARKVAGSTRCTSPHSRSTRSQDGKLYCSAGNKGLPRNTISSRGWEGSYSSVGRQWDPSDVSTKGQSLSASTSAGSEHSLGHSSCTVLKTLAWA